MQELSLWRIASWGILASCLGPCSCRGSVESGPSSDGEHEGAAIDAAFVEETDHEDSGIVDRTSPASEESGSARAGDSDGGVSCGSWGASTTASFAARSLIAIGYSDGVVTIHDTKLGVLRQFQAHDGWVRGLTISDDETLLVTSDDDGDLRLWSPADGHRVRSLSPGLDVSTDALLALAVSSDDRFVMALLFRQLSSGTTSVLEVFDISAGKQVWSIVDDVDLARQAFFSDAGANVLAIRENMATVYRREDGQIVRTEPTPVAIPSPALTVHTDIAGTTTLTDASGGVLAVSPGRGQWGTISTVRFSPTGSLVATQAYHSAGTDSLIVWDAVRHSKRWSIDDVAESSRVHPPSHAFAFSADSRFLFSISLDGSVRILGAEDGTPVRRLGHNAACVAPSSDGNRVYTCDSSKGIDVFEVTDGSATQPLDADLRVDELALSPDGSLLAAAYIDATGQGGAALYHLPEGRQLWKHEDGSHPNSSVDAPAVAFSSDAQHLVVARHSVPTLMIYDAVSGNSTPVTLTAPVSQADFSRDGRVLAVGTEKGVDLIRVSDGLVLQSLSGTGGASFATNDDRIVVADGSGHLSAYCGVIDSLGSRSQ
jgi:WD40 repeat protein